MKPNTPALYRVLLAATTPSDKSYLVYMAARLLEMRRLLKPKGALYLHCDPTMSHYLKLVLDTVFGRSAFRNEVVWKRTSSHNRAKRWGPVHDTLLFYTLGKPFTWNRVVQKLDKAYVEANYKYEDARGMHSRDNLTGPGSRTEDSGKPWKGIDPTLKTRHWELPPDRALPEWFVFPEGYASLNVQDRLDILNEQGLIYWPKKEGGMPRFRRYLNANSGAPVQDMVLDIPPLTDGEQENVNYPTQKPLKLLERIIEVSSHKKAVILDPFCGCATACVAAEKLSRQWVGIDISPKAADLVVSRMQDELGLFFQGVHRTDIPKRTDLGKVIPYNDAKNKRALYGEQGGSCNGCGEHFRPQNLEIDHIIPRAKGGTDHLENLQLLCGHCNRVKGDRGMEYLRTKLQMAA